MSDHNIPRSGDSPFRSAADKATSFAWSSMTEADSSNHVVLFTQVPPNAKKDSRDINTIHKKFYNDFGDLFAQEH